MACVHGARVLDVDEARRRLRARSATSSTEVFDGTPCLLWTGHVDPDGYPDKLQVGGIVTSAHRIASWAAYGPIPAGFQIDHRCHDPARCSATDACPHRRCARRRRRAPEAEEPVGTAREAW